jgi:hypothetical protein
MENPPDLFDIFLCLFACDWLAITSGESSVVVLVLLLLVNGRDRGVVAVEMKVLIASINNEERPP